MPSLNVLIQRGEICQCLRAKSLFYEDVAAPPDHRDPEGPFWCARTQSLLGPDGKVADRGSCRPGRSCCETA